jgi:hypothetical protein
LGKIELGHFKFDKRIGSAAMADVRDESRD